MAASSPAQIKDLYSHIQTLDTDTLSRQPYYVDPRAFSGLYIYPQLLRNAHVHKGLIDMLLHDELANPATKTNLHEKYHVTCPVPSKTDGDAHTSFFELMTSHVKMEPRLHKTDDWTASPLTTRSFIEKLRWFTTGDVTWSGSRASKVRKLFESILPIKARSLMSNVSSYQDPLGLRQNEGEARTFLDISLGCDAVFVVSLEQSNDEYRNAVNPKPQSVDYEESWRDLVVGLESDDDESARSPPHDIGLGINDKNETGDIGNTSDAPCLAAIHLRSTDGLLFTGPSRQAWYGVAKVLPGTSPTFEQDWPCWRDTVDGRGMEQWKGCMQGRRIDLVVR
ncbi:hypothetical protein LTR85_002113 [Meristemomyces frigidus]|nr:hypothetical protein LTR85_002113 [Meristemomyces frigidus]